MAKLLYWRWRLGLTVGHVLADIGDFFTDRGWRLRQHSAHHWYRPEFTSANPLKGSVEL
jgi:hypothetical protein